jgi:pimeloyl-ACP methyl ester carboxylesterase
MEREAIDVLPRLLQAVGFQRGLLIGHSDGASIATIYAGNVEDHRIQGLVLIAPHFFVEDSGLEAIARANEAYEQGDLRGRLARWHTDVDAAFRGWNGAWLDPAFRKWDITDALAYIRVPIAILQGIDDQYGTKRQPEVAEDECYCPVEVTMMAGVQHSPQREATDETLRVIADFASRVLDMGHDQQR